MDPAQVTARLINDSSHGIGYALILSESTAVAWTDAASAATHSGSTKKFLMVHLPGDGNMVAYPAQAQDADKLTVLQLASPSNLGSVAAVAAPTDGVHELMGPEDSTDGIRYRRLGSAQITGDNVRFDANAPLQLGPEAGTPLWSSTQGCFVGFAGNGDSSPDGRSVLLWRPHSGQDVRGSFEQGAASATVKELERRIFRLEEQLARVERLAVLPNYKIPSASSLVSLAELQLTGKRVLVKVDLDIPGKGADRNHFKYDRAARTINAVISTGAIQCLVLASQGVNVVDEFEHESSNDLEAHLEALRSRVQGASLIQVDRLDSISSSDSLVMLPNVLKISSTERAILQTASRKKLVNDAAKEVALGSDLREKLANFYDVFVLDDFRSTVMALPSNVGLAQVADLAIGLGLEQDLETLERLVDRCIRLGMAATNRRICIAGSSRPDSLEVVEMFLQRRLFDYCLVGPTTALLLLHAEGVSLPSGVLQLLGSLARNNGTHLADIVEGAAKSIIRNFSDRVVRPVDFVVRDARNGSRERVLDAGQLGELSPNERIASIGPSTVEAYCAHVESATLVFHFGMLGSSSPLDVDKTRRVIKSYAEFDVEAFMAGDHIVELANDLGLLGAKDPMVSAVTGADTTTYYMTGEALPGLAPFHRTAPRDVRS